MKKTLNVVMQVSFLLATLLPNVSYAYCNVYDQDTTHNSDAAIGNGTLFERAQSFSSSAIGTVGGVKIYLRNNGSPVDDLLVTLQGDNAGVPDNSPMDTITVPASSLTGSDVQYSLDFSSDHILSPATQYWVVLSRSGAQNATDYYIFQEDSIGGPQPRAYDITGGGAGWLTDTSQQMTLSLGTISCGGGGGGGGGGTSTVATSSVDQAEQNLSTAFFLFLFSMFGMLWIMRGQR